MAGHSPLEALQRAFVLKTLPRSGWLRRGVPESLCETVAGHSLRAAQAAFLYTADMHLVNLLMNHDLGEGGPGDLTPHDSVDPREKHRLERGYVLGIVSHLPDALAKETLGYWDEFAEQRTARAKLARQLDVFDASVMALRYESLGFETLEFERYTRPRLHDSELVRIFEKLHRREHCLQDSVRIYFSMLCDAKVQREASGNSLF